jgi:hypothetical protein
LSVEGLAEIAGELETTIFTGTETEVAPLAESVIVPFKVPGVVRPDVSMDTLIELELDTVTFAGLVLLFTNSQEPPDGVAVTCSPAVPPIATDCGVGVGLPI